MFNAYRRKQYLRHKTLGQSAEPILQPPDIGIDLSPPHFDIPTVEIPGIGTSYVQIDPSLFNAIQNVGTEVVSQGGTWMDFFKKLLQTGLATWTQIYLLKKQMELMGKKENQPVTQSDVSMLTTQLALAQQQQQAQQQKMILYIALGIGGLMLLLMLFMMGKSGSK